MFWSHVQFDDGAGRVAQDDPSIVREANFISSISLDGALPIDEAIRLTIADMPNALRLLENS